VDFNLSEVQASWGARARDLGAELPDVPAATDVVAAAARAGLLDPAIDLLAVAVAVEALAQEHASAAIAFALHSGVLLAAVRAEQVRGSAHLDALQRGEQVGAIALSSEDVPTLADGLLSGRASWVVPLTRDGFVIVGARTEDPGASAGLSACGAWASDRGVRVTGLDTAGLQGLVCGHVTFDASPCVPLDGTTPFMATIRVLLAAAGIGMGRRALRESLKAAHGSGRTGAGGEQTLQGLVADTATDLDAATLLTWKAASADPLSLAEASMAKLAATESTQRAVARATQVIGGESFRQGHVIERLAQDVRGLELFAGRTEALREAVALETLPR
jgi:alkylation response protein AidB-like acyl-CoA dehydrogenase